MRIGFKGGLEDAPEIRAGFIGCGSHSFRNLYPTFQFAPVKLAAVCDLDLAKARRFAGAFGAKAAYASHREMLAKESLDAAFLCTGYDALGRPRDADLAIECLAAGCHVWMEKPAAASCADVARVQAAAKAAGKSVMVGLKKMFVPANEKARELMDSRDFGKPHLATLQYPVLVPTGEELREYLRGGASPRARDFLDHLCHPASLLIFLLGMPETLAYERSSSGGGIATFRFASGAVASMTLAHGASPNGGMERTVVVSERGRHLVVENNVRVSLHRLPPVGYGDAPNFFQGPPGEATASWEPEFSLGQLYNKGLFLLGYYGEVHEFARSILEKRPPRKGTLEQARQVTRIFEAFAEGPGRTISLS